MAEVKRASFAIEDMKEGGGNLFGSNGPVRATLIAGKFTKEAPDNYESAGNAIFAAMMFELAGDAPVEERRVGQSYSLGAQAGDNFSISENGDYLIPTNDDAQIVKDCKFGTLAASLQNEGVPKTILADFMFSKIIGLDGDWKRVADKVREFANQNPKKQSKFPPSTLCLVKLHTMPGEAVKPAAATKKAAASTTAAAAPAAQAATTGAAVDVDTATWEYLEAVLKAKGGSEQRGRLTLAVSKHAMNDANRQAVARRASEESFIQTLVDAGLVTYGASEKGQPVALAAAA